MLDRNFNVFEERSVTTFLVLVVIGATISYAIDDFIKRRRLYHYASKLNGPLSLPFIGSAFYLFGANENIINKIVDLTKRYKSPWKIWLGRQLYIVVTEPEDIEVVLNKALTKARNYKFFETILRKGLFTAPADKWKRHKKVVSQVFSIPILNNYVEVFAEISQGLTDKLNVFVDEGFFDVFPILNQCSLEMTCETTMGKSIEDGSHNLDYVITVSKALGIVSQRLFHYWLHLNFVWKFTSNSKELDQISKRLNQFMNKMVTDKILQFRKIKQSKQDNYVEESLAKKCFLDYLIELSENGENWSHEEIVEEVQTIVAGGSDSLATIQSFTLMMIGMHPEIQHKVYDELYCIFGNSNRKVSYQDLSKMVYLEQVIKETLRIFPITAAIGRRLDHDIKTESYTLPKDAECIIGILYTHRNPQIWTDPMKFNPDRFLPEEVAKRHPYSYLPFSAGPRRCLGFKYVIMATKTIISTVVRNFKISSELKNMSEINFESDVVLKSAQGYRVALQRRILDG